jgi:hypothetical protein
MSETQNKGIHRFTDGSTLKIVTAASGVTDGTPAKAELISKIGAVAVLGSGYSCILNDTGNSKVYLVVTDGTEFYYELLTVAS